MLKANPGDYATAVENYVKTQNKIIANLKARLEKATTDLNAAYDTVEKHKVRTRTLEHFRDDNASAWSTWVETIKATQTKMKED
ncbi:hypothetical protein LTR12_003993 [Friedmanniomyces endolithicus]|nr:hypothetical protein LTR74_007861 [Friedmanniomyces endolithicus]KAK1821599.1 hypothetical protein LTR12_003993 [Friedmanniomyces endolithicus]